MWHWHAKERRPDVRHRHPLLQPLGRGLGSLGTVIEYVVVLDKTLIFL
jgi:hypothetical protein